MDTKDRVRELTDIIGRLARLIADENEKLAAHKVEEIAPMQDEKARLARLYEQHVRQVGESPEVLAELDDADRTELKEASADLAKRMEENERRLKTGAQAIERLMKAVAEAVRTKRGDVPLYGAKGATAGIPQPLSITVNQTL